MTDVSVTHHGHSNDLQSTCALSRFGQIMSDAIRTGSPGWLSWSVFVNRTGRLTMGAWPMPPAVLTAARSKPRSQSVKQTTPAQ